MLVLEEGEVIDMAAIGSVNPALSSLNQIQRGQQQNIQRISTGENYSSPAYGGAAYAITQRMNSNIGALGQSVQNTQNASAMLRIAAGATSNTVSALTTIRENLVNAANGTNTDTDRAALQQNISQLVRQVDTNARASYNGTSLLDGSRENITVAGISGYDNVALGDMRSQALGLTDNRGNVTISTDNLQASINTLNNAINFVGGVNENLNAALDGGDFALDAALDEATTQGAQLQRLDYQAANYTTAQENEQNAEATLNGADIARESIQLNLRKIQEEVALAMARLYRHNQASVLNLL